MRPGQIDHGLGKLTPEVWQWMFELLDWLSEFRETTAGAESGSAPRPQPRYRSQPYHWAQLRGWTNIATNRWRYSHREVVLDGSAFTLKDNGIVGSKDVVATGALNTCEAFHNGQGIEAPGVAVTPLGDGSLRGDDYPANYELRPIEGDTIAGGEFDGEQNGPVVPMWRMRDVDGVVRYVFFAVNHHDGACDP